tara:strand:+ start:417 stop:653 length:237 start_codon:yes stop_codon:yes gene_type:complete
MKDKMAGIEIERNIPIPRKMTGRTNEVAVTMEVGDSVLCEDRVKAVNIVACLRRNGMKSTTRKVENGIRVWRIENEKS